MKSINKITLGIGMSVLSVNVMAGSVDLSSLYQDSIENNPALKSAAYDIERAGHQRDQLSGLYRPQVDADIQYGAMRKDYTTLTEIDSQGASVGIRAGQNLYNQELNQSAQLLNQQQELSNISYQVALDSLQLSVAQRYLDTLKAQEGLKQADANLHAIEEQLTQIKHRYSNGLVPENDVKEAQAQFDLATTLVIFAQNDVEKALDGLYELTGKSYDHVSPLNLAEMELVIPTASQALNWEEQARTSSPQMLIQQQLVGLSKQQIQLAEAGHMPSLGLVAEYRYAFASKSQTTPMGGAGQGWTDLDDNTTLFAGVAMTLPVYRGGATSSKVEEASVQYQQSLQLQEQTWRQVTRDIRSTKKDLTALKTAKVAYEQAVKSAEAALIATEQGFELGTRTIVDVLNATQQVYQSKQQLSEAQIDFILSALKLKYLGGELTEGDLKAVNSLASRT